MAKFALGQMVVSPSGKEYRVTDVFNDTRQDARGQRYGIQRIRDNKIFGPFRNFYDASNFKLKTPHAWRE